MMKGFQVWSDVKDPEGGRKSPRGSCGACNYIEVISNRYAKP